MVRLRVLRSREMSAADTFMIVLGLACLAVGTAIRAGRLRDKPWYRRYGNPVVWSAGRSLPFAMIPASIGVLLLGLATLT